MPEFRRISKFVDNGQLCNISDNTGDIIDNTDDMKSTLNFIAVIGFLNLCKPIIHAGWKYCVERYKTMGDSDEVEIFVSEPKVEVEPKSEHLNKLIGTVRKNKVRPDQPLKTLFEDDTSSDEFDVAGLAGVAGVDSIVNEQYSS